MGIPGLARILIKKYPKIYRKTENVDFFFMDYNSLMYFVKNNLMIKENKEYELNKLSDKKYEKIFINKILNYTKHIVVDIVKPKYLLYIAIDGSVPFAKMVQQRLRRYKKKKVKEIDMTVYKEIKKSWNTNQITPGTSFMLNFSKKMQEFIDKNNFSEHLEHNLRVIFSDSSVPGEGEHKLIPYIKKIKAKEKYKFGIYGMDNDLIILAMLTYKNIFVINETASKYTNSTSEFMSLDIPMFRDLFMRQLELEKYDSTKIINDYAFLTFLGGNDFVKPIKFLKIKDGGLDIMLKKYKIILNKTNKHIINDDNTINYDIFKLLILELSNTEQFNLQIIQKRMNSYRHNFKYDPEDEKEKLKSYYYFSYYYDKVNPLYNKLKSEFQKINYLKNYRNDYYDVFFELNPINNKFVNLICKEYYDSLNWTLQYYLTGNPPSWSWSYPFRAAPLLKDFSEYLNLNKNIKSEFKKDDPYLPLQQLMFVLPPTEKKLLPKKYHNLMINEKSSIVEYYPIDFELDYLDGLKFEYSEPLLPKLNTENIINEIKNIKLTINEKERNKLFNKAFYFNFSDKISNSNRIYTKKIKIRIKKK